jgi:hypothetical protein
MSMPIDVCWIDVLLHKQSCTYFCQLYMSTLYCVMRCQIINTLVTRALALTHTLWDRYGVQSVLYCFLPSPHRELDLENNQLAVLPAGIFSGLTGLV